MYDECSWNIVLLFQVSGKTALHTEEQRFDLMYEQLRDLKAGKSVMKPIYNHVNGTLDTPEEIKPTPIVIIEGLHPFVDDRVRDLLDFTIYLDISDEIKFAWKIQRDMMERGHSLESIKASIEVKYRHMFVYIYALFMNLLRTVGCCMMMFIISSLLAAVVVVVVPHMTP